MKYEHNTSLQALVNELPQLMEDEGFVRSIYLDTEGYATFGVGTLITEDMPEYGMPVGTPVSDERCAEAFFSELIYQTLGDGYLVFGLDWEYFPIEVKQIFLNMLYNLGASRFSGFRRMIAAARNHNWRLVAIEAQDSKWFNQVGNRSSRLVRRLKVLA